MTSSGATVVVGAWGNDVYAGSAYVFTKTATGWEQTAELKGADTVASDDFGYSAVLSGPTAIVGALHRSGWSDAGRAYVFSDTGTGWKQVAELKGSDTGTYDHFG